MCTNQTIKDSSMFNTEDLTGYRQQIKQEVPKAKRTKDVHSFLTDDGRIFSKLKIRFFRRTGNISVIELGSEKVLLELKRILKLKFI